MERTSATYSGCRSRNRLLCYESSFLGSRQGFYEKVWRVEPLQALRGTTMPLVGWVTD